MNRRGAAFLLAFALVTAGSSTLAAPLSHTPSLRRDLEGYATAVCLVEAGDAYLKDQGHRWAGIVAQGRGVPLARLAPVDAAVKTRVAQGGMVVVRDEASPTSDRTLPLVFCARIIDAPAVRRALDGIAGARR